MGGDKAVGKIIFSSVSAKFARLIGCSTGKYSIFYAPGATKGLS